MPFFFSGTLVYADDLSFEANLVPIRILTPEFF
jgi:hypothetical protein